MSKKEKGARAVRGAPAGTLSGDSVNAVSPTTPPHLSLQTPTTFPPRLYCMPPDCPPICHKILNQEKKGYIRGTFHFLAFHFLRRLQLNAFETDDSPKTILMNGQNKQNFPRPINLPPTH